MQAADSVFMFISTLLVWIMTPGIAFFYGGMVRSKNVLSTAMHSYVPMAVVSVLWILAGYSISFSTNGTPFWGGLDWALLKDVTFASNPDYSAAIPHNLFMMFQMTFAVLTVAIISGAVAERMHFASFVIFTSLWSVFAYAPVAHWVWGVDGWLRELGSLDFAGGNVVHITSGVTGLVLALMLGKRKELDAGSPHNIPLTVLGASLIWFGWYGFNVGSALTINEVAMTAFVNTGISASAGIIGWLMMEWFMAKKTTMIGAVSGAISGLVAITPGCGFVTPISAMLIGLISGFVCFYGVAVLKKKMKYDDALDAFGLHGIGGVWGGIATGLFATTSVNSAGADGLFYGNISLLWKQLAAIGSTSIFICTVTWVLIKAIHVFLPIRVNENEEKTGLDLTFHGEKAYQETSQKRPIG